MATPNESIDHKYENSLDLDELTLNNTDFRRVVYTNKFSQLVVMSILPGEDIGLEVHKVDQIIKIERGLGIALIGNMVYPISDGSIINVPAGSAHNVRNNSQTPMKLYTIYSPPNETPGLVQHTKPSQD